MPRPTVAAAPGNLLEMQILKACCRPESKTGSEENDHNKDEPILRGSVLFKI